MEGLKKETLGKMDRTKKISQKIRLCFIKDLSYYAKTEGIKIKTLEDLADEIEFFAIDNLLKTDEEKDHFFGYIDYCEKVHNYNTKASLATSIIAARVGFKEDGESINNIVKSWYYEGCAELLKDEDPYEYKEGLNQAEVNLMLARFLAEYIFIIRSATCVIC